MVTAQYEKEGLKVHNLETFQKYSILDLKEHDKVDPPTC